MLGMIAGYGITDRMAASKPTLVADDRPTAPPSGAVRSAPPTITTTAPQVIVVIIDSATGKPIPPADPSALGQLETSQIPGTGAPVRAAPESTAPVPTLAPVPAPQLVDLAVPVPEPPAPAPAAPAGPAPAPQASSGGSSTRARLGCPPPAGRGADDDPCDEL
jgi:hypothetical protein